MSKLELPTLLLVTDNPAIRFWIHKHLNDQFFIITSHKLSELLEIAKSTRLDFVILDEAIEQFDVLETAQTLKPLFYSLTPMLLITGKLKKAFIQEALDVGITGFLNHHLDPNELKDQIQKGLQAATIRSKTANLSFQLAQPIQETDADILKQKTLFHHEALEFLESYKTTQLPLFLFCIRLDQWGKIQKQYDASNQKLILQHLSVVLSQSINKKNILIEEKENYFIILSKIASTLEASHFAEQLRFYVLEQMGAASHLPKDMSFSISIAWTSFRGKEKQLDQTIQTTKDTLKRAQEGSNLVICLTEETIA